MKKALIVIAVLAVAVGSAGADTITLEDDANALAAAVTGYGGAGLIVTSATFSGHMNHVAGSSGTFVDTGTYGPKGSGIVLSTGDVMDYEDGPNTSTGLTTGWDCLATPAQEALLDPITGGIHDHFDVSQLDIVFDMKQGFDTVYFRVVFGSEEWPEYVDVGLIEAFGLFINGVNIASVDGHGVDINHPDMMAIPGTELDAVLAPNGNPVLQFAAKVGEGSVGNTLTIILGDTSDEVLDTTVFVSSLGGSLKSLAHAPVPSAVWSGLALLGVLGIIRRRRRQR